MSICRDGVMDISGAGVANGLGERCVTHCETSTETRTVWHTKPNACKSTRAPTQFIIVLEVEVVPKMNRTYMLCQLKLPDFGQ